MVCLQSQTVMSLRNTGIQQWFFDKIKGNDRMTGKERMKGSNRIKFCL